MKKIYLSISSALLSFSAVSADLTEVFLQSEKHDPQLSAAKHTLNASSEGKKQAFSTFLPQVSASMSASTSDTESTTDKDGNEISFTSDSDNRGWRVSLSQTLYNHANYQNYKISKLQVLQSEAEYTTAYQDFILRVANAYFNVLGAKDSLLFSEAEEKAIQRQLDQAEQRFEVGLAAITDVHEARARYDGARASVIIAQNLLDDANEALFEMSQQYYTELTQVPNDVDYGMFQLKTMDAYQELALAQNPDLMVAKVSSDISEKQIGVSRSGHFPTLSLSARKNHSFSPNTVSTQFDLNTQVPVQFESGDQTSDTNSISLNLNIPIYSGGRTSSQVRQSASLHSAAMDRHEMTRRNTVRSVRNAYHGTLAAKSSVDARKQAMISAESGLEATEAGYEVGTRTIVDVLNSQRSLYQAQRDYSQAKYDYFIQYLTLKRASGTLNAEDIFDINNKVLK